jgi:hypothetical protein
MSHIMLPSGPPEEFAHFVARLVARYLSVPAKTGGPDA